MSFNTWVNISQAFICGFGAIYFAVVLPTATASGKGIDTQSQEDMHKFVSILQAISSPINSVLYLLSNFSMYLFN